MALPKQESAYQVHAADWRAQLKKNDSRTRLIMATFVLIYLVVGFVFDLYLHPVLDQFTLVEAARLLVTFQVTPIATLITGTAAIISILIAYAFYDKIVMLGTDHKEITPKTATNLEEQQLYNVIEELKMAAGLRFMPRVFIIEAPYMNAFASGYSEKSALVAITRGLMQKLNRSELQAVMAHELSHIRHHDIKLTMAASIMCNIILIALDIAFRGVLFTGGGRSKRSSSSSDSEGRGGNLVLIIILLRFTLPILTMLLMLFLSRTREFMADAGAVELTRDNTPLANALLKIEADHKQNQEQYAALYQNTAHEEVRRSAYIFEPVSAGVHARQSLATLFSTHPPLAERLKALGFKKP
jgi:heat shock protein HtpX